MTYMDTIKTAQVGVPDSTQPQQAVVPAYMHEVYEWAYLNPRNVKFLDREFIVSLILWGNNQRLKRALLTEINADAGVLQAAHVYGTLIPEIAASLSHPEQLEIVEVSPLQAGRCQGKLNNFPQVNVRIDDVAFLRTTPKDLVSSFFLLHEIPSDYKRAVVNTLLAHVNEGGKAVFIDYHRPHKLHPLKFLMMAILKLFEPFAMELWNHEISEYASNPEKFIWRKQTFFGGLYQKVVVERRPNVE